MANNTPLDLSEFGATSPAAPAQAAPATSAPLDLSEFGATSPTAQPAAQAAPAQQAGPVSRLVGSFDTDSGLPPGSVGDYMTNLHEGGAYLMRHPIDSVKMIGQSMLGAQSDQAKKAVDAYGKGNYAEAIARALYSGIPIAGPILANAGDKIQSGDLAGAAGSILAIALPGTLHTLGPAMGEAMAHVPGEVKAKIPTATLEGAAPAGKPLQAAGEAIQQAAAENKADVGAQIGAEHAKIQSANPNAVLTVTPDSAVYDRAQKLVKEAGGKPQLPGETTAAAKEPKSVQYARSILGIDQEGKPAPNPPGWSYQDLKAEKTHLQDLIDAEKNPTGGYTAEGGRLIKLKQALGQDEYDMYEQNADPDDVDNLKALRKTYAGLMQKDAATNALNNVSPEKAVKQIVSQGAGAQSLVEDLMDHAPDAEDRNMLQDSVTRELYRTNTLPSGDIDTVKANEKFKDMGDTAKSLYGPRYDEMKTLLQSAADWQEQKVAAVERRSRVKRVGADATAVAVGGLVGGVPGAIIGASASEALRGIFKLGHSGALQIGVSPREIITLSPEEAATPGVAKAVQSFVASKDVNARRLIMDNIEKLTNPEKAAAVGAGTSANAAEQQEQVPPVEAGFFRVKDSAGSVHDIPKGSVAAAKLRDPGLTVIEEGK